MSIHLASAERGSSVVTFLCGASIWNFDEGRTQKHKHVDCPACLEIMKNRNMQDRYLFPDLCIFRVSKSQEFFCPCCGLRSVAGSNVPVYRGMCHFHPKCTCWGDEGVYLYIDSNLPEGCFPVYAGEFAPENVRFARSNTEDKEEKTEQKEEQKLKLPSFQNVRNSMLQCKECGYTASEFEWDEVWSFSEGGFISSCCPKCRTLSKAVHLLQDSRNTGSIYLHGIDRIIYALGLKAMKKR